MNERVKSAKHQYILGKLDNASNSKNQWRINDSIINPKSNPVINSIEHEGIFINDLMEIASANAFFARVGSDLAASIPVADVPSVM